MFLLLIFALTFTLSAQRSLDDDRVNLLPSLLSGLGGGAGGQNPLAGFGNMLSGLGGGAGGQSGRFKKQNGGWRGMSNMGGGGGGMDLASVLGGLGGGGGGGMDLASVLGGLGGGGGGGMDLASVLGGLGKSNSKK